MTIACFHNRNQSLIYERFFSCSPTTAPATPPYIGNMSSGIVSNFRLSLKRELDVRELYAYIDEPLWFRIELNWVYHKN